MAEVFGIDVSSWQGDIDWEYVKRSGIKFAVLRCHQKTGIDETFKANYKACKKLNIPVGAYKLSYAMTKAQAKAEAKKVVKVLGKKDIALPVFLDLETAGGQESLEASEIAVIAETFLTYVSNAGFRVGIYCNKDWYSRKISQTLKDKYDFWIASYPGEDEGRPVERVRPGYGIGWQYSQRGRIEGISGSVDLDLFDASALGLEDELPIASPEETIVIDPGTTAQDILTIARAWIGRNGGDGSHREIIDLYNAHTPRARGYAVQYTDSWCDTFVSACFIKAGAVSLIGGTECGVEEHVKLFKAAGIWMEDGTITPEPGDIIVFNWDQSYQPNDGYADHIGLVEAIGSGMIGTIEGNASNAVRRRQYQIGHGNIRGYARPKYGQASHIPAQRVTTVSEVAQAVIKGYYGNGQDRIDRLKAAGYDPDEVQAEVNKLLS